LLPGPREPASDEAASTTTLQPHWAPPRTTRPSTRRPTTRHSYKGLYDLHVPSINVKAATKKSDEYDKNKHPNDGIAKREGLKSGGASRRADRLASHAALAVSIGWLLLLRLAPG